MNSRRIHATELAAYGEIFSSFSAADDDDDALVKLRRNKLLAYVYSR